MIPIISIVGHSGSGKTTLIERVVPILKQRGYKVGALKHDAHKFDIDYAGKDTWRMKEAGADAVAISSTNKMAFVKTFEKEKSIDEIALWLFADMDIIITEGYKAFEKPKLEVVRKDGIITSLENGLIAIIDNTSEDVFFSLPDSYKCLSIFNMINLEAIADFIEDRFLS